MDSTKQKLKKNHAQDVPDVPDTGRWRCKIRRISRQAVERDDASQFLTGRAMNGPTSAPNCRSDAALMPRPAGTINSKKSADRHKAKAKGEGEDTTVIAR